MTPEEMKKLRSLVAKLEVFNVDDNCKSKITVYRAIRSVKHISGWAAVFIEFESDSEDQGSLYSYAEAKKLITDSEVA